MMAIDNKAKLCVGRDRRVRDALLIAELETGLLESAFPPSCPWSFEQIVDPDFGPEAA